MKNVMIPCDDWDLRLGVFDGAHDEEITPPTDEKDRPLKGWFILDWVVTESVTMAPMREALDVVPKGANPDEPVPFVERSITVIYGKPKSKPKLAVVPPEPKLSETKPAEPKPADPEPETPSE